MKSAALLFLSFTFSSVVALAAEFRPLIECRNSSGVNLKIELLGNGSYSAVMTLDGSSKTNYKLAYTPADPTRAGASDIYSGDGLTLSICTTCAPAGGPNLKYGQLSVIAEGISESVRCFFRGN